MLEFPLTAEKAATAQNFNHTAVGNQGKNTLSFIQMNIKKKHLKTSMKLIKPKPFAHKIKN